MITTFTKLNTSAIHQTNSHMNPMLIIFPNGMFIPVCSACLLQTKTLDMIDSRTVRKLALSFDEAEEAPHFEKTAFRVRKKIFATLDTRHHRVVLKLSLVDQSVFAGYKKDAIYPVPNAWGKQGWTVVEMKKVRKDMFTDALTTAYCTVAPKKLAAKYSPDDNL